jgi:ubiquinone/menaquinone biosynthesis C-methylase UbiE
VTLKLDIGAGIVKRPGYVSVDLYDDHAQIRAPAHDLPYKDGEVDEVFTSHMIEHLPPPELGPALVEWHRVLKPGGRLVIRCPNFELYVKEFLESDCTYRFGQDGMGKGWGIINIYGHQTGGPGYLTRTGFTVERFKRILPRFGFRVTCCETTRTRVSHGVEYRPNGDIICEAVKE